jgi:hypothetical protein
MDDRKCKSEVVGTKRQEVAKLVSHQIFSSILSVNTSSLSDNRRCRQREQKEGQKDVWVARGRGGGKPHKIGKSE